MTSPSPHKPELLAPAGSLEVFAAAVAAGADAVYIGAPAFNARNLAKHFSGAEVAAMIDYGHNHDVKVYLAMNSLMKEEEIAEACELLALCEGLQPDAIIMQDLGLFHLARTYFPSLELHASTLMAAHNSVAVRHYAQMGYERVVLARELTLNEIEAACRQGVEIEVFVHGALCFSYSGLCLFSSYLGGKSGLRGRCVQPCRRRYSLAAKGRGKGKSRNAGYLFSMHDLNGLDAVEGLCRAGVASLKIEGRMRSRHYVESVVAAYRLVLDHGDEAMVEAQKLIDLSMGRTATKGYFAGGQPDDALAPQRSGNIGIFLGRLGTIDKDWVSIKLKSPLALGDRLRLHQEKSGERVSFNVKGMRSRGEQLSSAGQGWKVEILISGATLRAGDSLYKVDVKGPGGRKSPIKAGPFAAQVAKIGSRGVGSLVMQRLGLKEAKITGRSKHGKSPQQGRSRQLPLWLQGDSWQLLSQSSQMRPTRVVLNLTPATLGQVQRQKRPGRLGKVVIWSLPPVILEEDLDFFAVAVTRLVEVGFHQFQISHISQLQFFPEGERFVTLPDRKRKGGGAKTRKLAIYGNYTLNILNSLALRSCSSLGIYYVTLAIEQDEENFKRVLANKGRMSTGLTVYSRPPLFTARLDSEHFSYNQPLVSPKGERFILQRRGGQTVAVSEEPFSLLTDLADLAQIGLDYGVLDTSGLGLGRRELEHLFRLIDSPPARQKKRHSSFNFRATQS